MRRLHRLRFLIALLPALAFAACGDEAPTQTPTPTPGETPVAEAPEPATTPKPIRFVKGFAAGVEAAGDADALLFVYVARHKPT